MQVGGQYRQCDGAREAVGAMAADTVEPPVFQPIDGRLDCQMRTPRGHEGFLRVWCNKAAEVGESAKQGQCEWLLPQ